MGIISSLLLIYQIKKLIKLNSDINGKWITYLYAFIHLLMRRRSHKSNRVMRHDVWKDDPRHAGIIPFKHEWDYELPSKNRSEDIVIYGTNSKSQNLFLSINWRPNEVQNNKIKVKANVRFSFVDNDGNHYDLDEESIVDYNDKEYRACGLGFEIMCPFRRDRLKFRGYLKKNNKELVYVRIRFLWLGLSRVYDFNTDFNDYDLAKELTQSEGSGEPYFEDRIEQMGQMKGTFIVGNEKPRIVYLWGSKSKKYLPKESAKSKIIRIFGYNKKGFGFHIGLVSNQNQIQYRYGFLFPISGHLRNLTKTSLKFSDFERLTANTSETIRFKAEFDDRECDFEIIPQKIGANKLILNGAEGMCFVVKENDTEYEKCKINENSIKVFKNSSLVLCLTEESAKSVDLSGGKGSSLSHLIHLRNKLSEEHVINNFNVPKGVVVTTNAYKEMVRETGLESKINELEKIVSSEDRKDMKTKCEQLVELVSQQKLPKTIRSEIESKLRQIFSDFENKLFAVRSSAAGEDSEEMSAAGQMTTYLGIKKIDDISDAVMKCWSSQFSFIAVEYKRGYGQTINSPMAVVVQEMVDCDSAGVIFTCDPITGDERLITITANYGLGESVVSATAEPDSIKVSVNISANSLMKSRNINKIESKEIGAKKKVLKLGSNGGVVEEDISDNNNCCVSDEDLIRLAELSVKIHCYYGNARDIEWGIKSGQIFMLQSRPITNLDNSFTEYEIMHEIDSAHNSEFEIYSRAHWGENYPGSSSWNSITWTGFANKSILFRMSFGQGLLVEDYNPFVPLMGIEYNQVCFNLTNGSAFMDMFIDYPESKRTRQMILAFFGHDIDDEDVLQLFRDKRVLRKKASILTTIKMVFGMLTMLYFGPRDLMKSKKDYMENDKLEIAKYMKPLKSSKQMYDFLMFRPIDMIPFKNHGAVSFGSSLKSGILRAVMEGAKANNPFLESDLNLLISSCNDVVSAEVPNTLRDIAKSIKDKKSFKLLSDDKALEVLKNGTDESSEKFRQFLSKHGHRGYREADPLHLPWGRNPMPCVKTIKSLLSGDDSLLEPKISKPIEEIMKELKTPLSFFRRVLIGKYLLPWTRDAVGYREHSKYFMIWGMNKTREAYWSLARQMTRDGLIPETDLYFYLTPEEVEKLCNGNRDPLIVSKARLRKRISPKMDKYKFEEFMKGPEMIPRNLEENIPKINGSVNGLVKMSGTAVSNGRIKARVCVSEDITEADNIQPGDILITYSTDIGWSPYFPIISGIVTEIGGTISHGAVIAREFGIPCLIAVEGACRTFTTGDICILDTELGQIIKVE